MDNRPLKDSEQKLTLDLNSIGPNAHKHQASETTRQMGQSSSGLTKRPAHPNPFLGTSVKAKKVNAHARAFGSLLQNPIGQKQPPHFNQVQ